jgi:hypothetical protein
MHRGIAAHQIQIDATNVGQLEGMAFVFLSMDSGEAKCDVIGQLEAWGTPFVDVGMGLYVKRKAELRPAGAFSGARARKPGCPFFKAVLARSVVGATGRLKRSPLRATSAAPLKARSPSAARSAPARPRHAQHGVPALCFGPTCSANSTLAQRCALGSRQATARPARLACAVLRLAVLG